MNLNRLVATVLRAIADELEPIRESRNANPVTAEPPAGNDPPLEVPAWQPDDVERHGLERGPGFRVR